MTDKYSPPKLTLALFHPANWKVWIGFGLLALFVNALPYRLLFKIGRKAGEIGMRYGKKRVHVANRNLELAFPDMTEEERNKFVAENFRNTGLALIETGIAWFWPTWRFKRLIEKGNISKLEEFHEHKRGVLLCCPHALNLEITARACGVFGLSGFGVYRPHNNPAYDFIQVWGRTHNGNALVHRKDLKQMLRLLRRGERLFYLPDHDYGRNKSAFVPFFAVQDACTTTGTSILVNASKCEIVLLSGFRNQENKYEFIADLSVADNFPHDDEVAAAAYINKHLETVIMRAPEQWMWLHKRYKTMLKREDKGIRYK